MVKEKLEEKEEKEEKSAAFLAFQDIMEKYKIKNPVKFAQKKEELERKLALLK